MNTHVRHARWTPHALRIAGILIVSLMLSAFKVTCTATYESFSASMPYSDVNSKYAAGASAGTSYVKLNMLNGHIANTGGSAVLAAQQGGVTRTSKTVPYIVSGDELRFQDPQSVDKWIKFAGSGFFGSVDTLSIGVNDLQLVATDGTSQVCVEYEGFIGGSSTGKIATC